MNLELRSWIRGILLKNKKAQEEKYGKLEQAEEEGTRGECVDT